ncbi:MAG: DNA phosphorothioation-dependent restriction protein DptG [Gammaproteobacteria bacterium]|nr:DNA phosphorothioation-dependent restriction protein DptG [Gammaproteobacteria bacterium]
MSKLKSNLTAGNNVLNSYFPSRTSIAKEGDFDWGVAAAIVIRNLYRKRLNSKLLRNLEGDFQDKEKAAIAKFEEVCRADFHSKLDETELWIYIKEMYFDVGSIYQLAPESLLFKLAPLTASSAQHRLADMFSSLMHGFNLPKIQWEASNFIESQVIKSLQSEVILEEMKDNSQTLSKGINEKPYLPFLTQMFRRDLQFLGTRPKYLLAQIDNLLRLYGYLYTAQLALNIKNTRERPIVRPLYFILENESASRERTNLSAFGHQAVQKAMQYIFPYLSMNESLQFIDKEKGDRRIPLWELAETLSQNDSIPLRKYAKEFAKDRNEEIDFVFDHDETVSDPHYWLEVLLKTAVDQFGKKRTRAAAQEKFVRTTEHELCSTFAKSRGQAGKVLVMNQDYITLITNLAVGEKEKLRLGDLIKEFNYRGIFFDKQSQQALVRFYERVGNVERMSDSGDAVYVRKTL